MSRKYPLTAEGREDRASRDDARARLYDLLARLLARHRLRSPGEGVNQQCGGNAARRKALRFDLWSPNGYYGE
jgi:hypothetical protein